MAYIPPCSLGKLKSWSTPTLTRKSILVCSQTQNEPPAKANQALSRRQMLGILGISPLFALLGAPRAANAFCGEQSPYWAHFLEWEEKVVAYGDQEIYVRTVGSFKKEKQAGVAPILFIPDIGLSHDYLEPLEALSESNRRLIFYDPLGTGYSSKVDKELSYSEYMQDSVNQVQQVISSVKDLDKFSIFGHGLGASIAIQFADKYPEKVLSLVLESPASQYDSSKLLDYRQLLVAASTKKLPICAEESFQTLNTSVIQRVGVQSGDSTKQFVIGADMKNISALVFTSRGDVLTNLNSKSIDPARNQVVELDDASHTPHLILRNLVLQKTADFLDDVEAKAGFVKPKQ